MMKCIEGDCDTCFRRDVCTQDGPTKEFSRWSE